MSVVRFFIAAVLLQGLEVNSEKVNVGILHYNDILAQYQSYKGQDPSQPCASSDEAGCTAGVAQLMGHVESIFDNDFGHLDLDFKFSLTPGNILSGENAWLSVLEGSSSFMKDNPWEVLGKTLKDNWINYMGGGNYFRPNYTSLGPKDFEGGLKNLATFLKTAEIRPIISNINCKKSYPAGSEEEDFCGYIDYHDALIYTDAVKIGLVGFVDLIVVHKSEPGGLEFIDLVTAMSSIAENELASTDFIVAMGTGSLETIQKLMDAVPKIKIVVYGGGDEAVSSYPIKYGDGLIVTTDGKYGKSLGKLEIQFDTVTKAVDVVTTNSEIVANDRTVDFDYYGDSKIKDLLRTADGLGNAEIALLKTNLEGSSSFCKGGECDIGNLITDAMVHCAMRNLTNNAPSDLIAVWHDGALSGKDFLEHVVLKGYDVRKMLPFHNQVNLVTINGSVLTQIFQTSATGLGENPRPNWDQYLHVSRGIQVSYKYSGFVGHEYILDSLKVIQKDSSSGHFVFRDVDPSGSYHLLIPSSIYNGRSAYYWLPGNFGRIGNVDRTEVGRDDICLENYLKGLGVVGYLGEERRVTIESGEAPEPTQETEPTTIQTESPPQDDETTEREDHDQTHTTDNIETFETTKATTTTTTTEKGPQEDINPCTPVIVHEDDMFHGSPYKFAVTTAGLATLFNLLIFVVAVVIWYSFQFIGHGNRRRLEMRSINENRMRHQRQPTVIDHNYVMQEKPERQTENV